MPKLDFSLQVISPAFVAGAMEKQAETNLRDREGNTPKHRLIGDEGLRVPSLRGILRFWFRAKEDGSNPQAVFQKEVAIFGDTQSGQGIRMIPTGKSSWQPAQIGTTEEFVSTGGAQAYLGYGPLNYVSREQEVSSHNKSAFRDAIPEGQVFHFRAIGSTQQLDELRKCLLLLHLFGGIGSRSRRAWGSVAVIGNFIPALNKNESIKEWFERTLELVWPDQSKPSQKPHLPKFSAFFANSAIRISASRGSYKEVMEEFYRQFRATRLWRTGRQPRSTIAQNDHDWEMRDSTGSDVNDVPLRLAFGMPYFPKSREHNWEIEYFGYYPNPKNPGKLEEIDRRASPLFLKVFHGPGQKLYAVALFLKAEFFGEKKVEIGKDQKGKKLPFSSWKAVEEFMNCADWQTISLP